MSIGINSACNSNGATTYTDTKNSSSLVQLLREGAPSVARDRFDVFEGLMDSSYRDEIISNPNLISNYYCNYFWNALTIEVSLSYYEKGREEILKTFVNDTELLNTHLHMFDEAFEAKLQRQAFSISMSLKGERILALQYERKGIEFEANKLATHKNFDGENFYANAKNVLKEFGQAFINNIKSGMSYADAQKNSFDYMEELYRTTSVNSLSLNDLLVVEKSWFGKHEESRSELNKNFNSNPELSPELRRLISMGV